MALPSAADSMGSTRPETTISTVRQGLRTGPNHLCAVPNLGDQTVALTCEKRASHAAGHNRPTFPCKHGSQAAEHPSCRSHPYVSARVLRTGEPPHRRAGAIILTRPRWFRRVFFFFLCSQSRTHLNLRAVGACCATCFKPFEGEPSQDRCCRRRRCRSRLGALPVQQRTVFCPR